MKLVYLGVVAMAGGMSFMLLSRPLLSPRAPADPPGRPANFNGHTRTPAAAPASTQRSPPPPPPPPTPPARPPPPPLPPVQKNVATIVNKCYYDCQTEKVWKVGPTVATTYPLFRKTCGKPEDGKVVFSPWEPTRCFPQIKDRWFGLTAPRETYRDGLVLDFSGVWTQYKWDCDETGGPNYRSYVPSRGLDCSKYEQMTKEGGAGKTVVAEVPSIDEEFFEWLDVMAVVMTAENSLNIVEVGARYGTWAARAWKLNQRMHTPPLPIHLTMVEPNIETNIPCADKKGEMCTALACLKQHMKNNGIPESDTTVLEKKAAGHTSADGSSISITELLKPHSFVDLLDIDIQGFEDQAVPPAMEAIKQKVKLLHIGSHGRAMHKKIMGLLQADSDTWLILANFAQSTEVSTTEEGRVVFRDGVISALNKNLRGKFAPHAYAASA